MAVTKNFRVKRNRAPKFIPERMKCDVKISEKNEAWELARDHLNTYNTIGIIGRQGSGKTTLMLNFFKELYKKKVHRIWLFMPASSRASLKDNIFAKLDAGQVFEELTPENMEKVYEGVRADAENGLKSLVIFDDVQSALKNRQVLDHLKKFIANQRHLHLVNMILMQNYYSLDKSLRELINNLVFFKLDKSQTKKIFDNVMEMKETEFLALNKFIFDKPRNWCFINLPSGRIYKQWDEVEMENNSEV